MNAPSLPPPRVMSSWSASFFTKLYRIRSLLRRRWWILLLTTGLSLGYQSWSLLNTPAIYISNARMMVSPQISIQEKTSYSEEYANFFGTQIELMTSGEVRQKAAIRVKALYPDMPESDAHVSVFRNPQTAIFSLQARGSEPLYTQRYLDAVMDEFIRYKEDLRSSTSERTLSAITEQAARLEKELEKNQELLFSFQKENDVVLVQEQGNLAGQYLINLEKELADMNREIQLLDLLSIDQKLERDLQNQSGNQPGLTGTDAAGTGPKLDYLKARQQIQLMNAQLEELSAYLKPKHPKIMQLREDISRQDKLLEIYRQQSIEQVQERKKSLSLQIENTRKSIADWQAKALESSRVMAEYSRLKSNVERVKTLYDRLLATMQNVNVTSNVDTGSLSVLEKSSPAIAQKPGVVKAAMTGLFVGLALGAVILFFLDRIDDRLTSFSELSAHFEEPVVGQIPMENPAPGGRVPLLTQDDKRHVYAEAFRNIRSSLLYMTSEENRPKTILVTSAIPGDGKSTVAGNLAVTLALSGSKVLLVDADMRKGVLHEGFSMESNPGLADVLGQKMSWDQAVRATHCPTLAFIPRGSIRSQIGELLLSPAMQIFLHEAHEVYDYVIIDSPPVLASDDTPSLAPKVDGVIMVLRASYTSTRLAQNSLDLLAQRQVRVLGLVFNCIDTNLPDYYHYQYYKSYYNT